MDVFAPPLPSGSIFDTIYPDKQCKQNWCSLGHGRARPNWERPEDVGDCVATMGECVNWTVSKQIRQVGWVEIEIPVIGRSSASYVTTFDLPLPLSYGLFV